MNPFSHPGTHVAPSNDVEKGALRDTSVNVTAIDHESPDPASSPTVHRSRLARLNAKIEGLAGLEARGISRVLPEEKHGINWAGYIQSSALWFSMSLSIIDLPVGLLGPLVFGLGWVDCVCIVIFANALSCCGPAYTAAFGCQSGHRTMILSRYFMGYWPAKLACILNIIMQAGWGVLGCIVAGQMFSAVNGSMSIAVGRVIAALCVGILATFGIAILHTYERYAWAPQMFAILVLIGSSGRYWDTSLVSASDTSTITADRCSFFGLVFSSAVGFTAIAADFYVYYPVNTDRRLIFATTWAGAWSSTVFVDLIGVGIATGVAANTNPAWTAAYSTSSAALVLACYDGLGRFGHFCTIVLALGCIQNIAPSTYVGALSIQTLGRYGKAVPRWIWCVFMTIVELVCAVAGRNNLYNIFENFLPIMAYWVCPWVTIVLEEHLIFHRGVPFDWAIWEDPRKLPVGAAALLSWLIGWAGAIIGMAQVWYTGPIALSIGGYGGDIGEWLSIAFAGVVYPPLRYIELRKFGR